MLIVFSGNTSWSMYNFRLGVMKKMMDFGYDVCVVAPEDGYSQKLKAEGIQFIPIKNLKRFGINPIQDFILYREYRKAYQSLQPAFIFHYTIKPNIYGTLAAKVCNFKSISITTGLGNAFANKGPIFYFAKYLYKLSSTFAIEVWFLNSSDRELFIRNRIISKHKTFILPGEGVDTAQFIPSLNYPENKATTFLLISRMRYDKGIQIFVEATRILLKKGYRVASLLLGEIKEDTREAITSEAIALWQQEGIVEYLGSTKDVKPYIEKADAVVLPSYYQEGIPRVLLEAACMEKPIITTRNPGCVEVVDDGINGFLCEIKDVASLADKMEKFILLTMQQKKKMGSAGRKKVQASFDEKIIIDIYRSKFEYYALS